MLKTLLLLSFTLCVSATFLSGATTRPNIVLIVADDMRADAIHALGNDAVQTPNIDLLVKRGASFFQVYNMGSTVPGVGASSRAMLLSGRSLFRFSGDLTDSKDDMPLLPEILRNAGYATFATGKWQNGHRWFERSFSHGDEIIFGTGENEGELEVFDFDETGAYAETAGHRPVGNLNENFAEATATFLRDRPRGKPFFAYVSFSAPTVPQDVPQGYRSLYAAKQPQAPANYLREQPIDIDGKNPRPPMGPCQKPRPGLRFANSSPITTE